MDKKDDQSQPRGFKGLSSMASDIGPVQGDGGKAEAGDQEEAGGRTPGGTPAPRSENRYQSASNAGWTVVVGLALLLALGWLGERNTHGTTSSGNPIPSTPSPSQRSQPRPPAVQPPPSTADPPSDSSSSERMEPASGALEESRPPVGAGHVLNLSQIRYCLAQSLRIDGADPVVDTSSELEVDIFNEWVDDYNSRCSDFRYYEGSLGRARQDIEPYREQLLLDGKIQFYELTFQEQRVGTSSRQVTPETGNSRESPTAASPQAQRTQSEPLPSRTRTGKPDLSDLQVSERQGIERACNYERRVEGPAAYYGCLTSQIRELSRYRGKPDLAGLSQDERQGVERACNYERRVEGPAAYYGCLSSQLRELSRFSGKPDLSQLSEEERRGIERACNFERRVEGPAAYYRCLVSELRRLGHGEA